MPIVGQSFIITMIYDLLGIKHSDMCALYGRFKCIFRHHSIKKLAKLKISEDESSAIQNNYITLLSVIITINQAL